MLTLALQGKHLEAAGVTLVSLYRQALLYCNIPFGEQGGSQIGKWLRLLHTAA